MQLQNYIKRQQKNQQQNANETLSSSNLMFDRTGEPTQLEIIM